LSATASPTALTPATVTRNAAAATDAWIAILIEPATGQIVEFATAQSVQWFSPSDRLFHGIGQNLDPFRNEDRYLAMFGTAGVGQSAGRASAWVQVIGQSNIKVIDGGNVQATEPPSRRKLIDCDDGRAVVPYLRRR
jgi:hypothetical protein